MAIDDPAAPGRVRVLVVGLDGGEGSTAALAWAAAVLDRHGLDAAGADAGCELHAVRATSAPPTPDQHTELERWTASVRSHAVEVTCHVVADDPAVALLTVADGVGAELVVVGAHSRHGLAPRSIGKVTTHLVETANRPVAVIAAVPDTPPAQGTTVVAGAGHGRATTEPLAWAMGFAADHGTALSLVHAVTHRPMFNADGLLDVLAFYVDPSLLNEWALQDLADVADELQHATEQDVPLSWSAPLRRPGPALVEAGGEAALIVIGRHGDDGSAAHVTSTVRYVLSHAPCPVVVVPANSRSEGSPRAGCRPP